MSQKVGNAGVEVLLCARDGIRFLFHGLLQDDSDSPPEAPTEELPPRRVRVQAAWPPPKRTDGKNWMVAFDDLDAIRGVFQNLSKSSAEYGSAELSRELEDRGLVKPEKLLQPDPGTLILNQEITAKFQWARTAAFRPPKKGDPIPTSFYPQLEDDAVPVAFHDEFELPWSKPIEPGEFVAISFDQFKTTKNTTPFVVQVTDAWLFAPPKGAASY